jgi:hypothetical protein
MPLPDFLPGFFHLVEFRDLRRSQVVFSPRGDLTIAEAIRSAAEIIARVHNEPVAPEEVVRVTGPFPVATCTIVTLADDLLRECTDEDDNDRDGGGYASWRVHRAK